MSEAIIQVYNLGKRYQIGVRQEAYGTLREAISSAAMVPLTWLKNRGRNDRPQEFWALRDVSFEVHQGEVLGIIGRNGAGKSTLLKILSRVIYPTEGQADLSGRVGSLLEVGTGFHPELTGRENIFLNGAVLGMKRAEIQNKFDEIVDFAEIEQFLDTPVKRYSSGMYMRLAFAVAAHLEPDILIVDEVLAVGDAAFQKKCLGKMGTAAKDGRTVLFVSHNLLAVENLCDWAICLEGGKLVKRGDAGEVISAYLRHSLSISTERSWKAKESGQVTEAVHLQHARVRPTDGSGTGSITVHTPFSLEFDYWNSDPTAQITVCFSLYNQHNILLFNIGPPIESTPRRKPSPTGLLRTICHIPGDFLNDGLHRVDVTIFRNDVPIINESHALIFNIQDSLQEREDWYGDWPGALRPSLKWENNLVLIPEDHNHAP